MHIISKSDLLQSEPEITVGFVDCVVFTLGETDLLSLPSGGMK